MASAAHDGENGLGQHSGGGQFSSSPNAPSGNHSVGQRRGREVELGDAPADKKWPGWPREMVFRLIGEETRVRIKILMGVAGSTNHVIKGLPTDNRQPILAVCKYRTTVKENSPDVIPEIFTTDGQQKGHLCVVGSGSSRSYDIIVECDGSAESYTGSTMTALENLLIGGGQPFYTVGRHINPRSAIDPPDLGYNPVNWGLDMVDLSCKNTDLK